MYNAEKNIIELLFCEAEEVIANIQVKIQEEVNEENPKKFEYKKGELQSQHSSFQKKQDQRRMKKWKKVTERNIESHEAKNYLRSCRIKFIFVNNAVKAEIFSIKMF